MRILMVTDAYAPLVGGVEQHVRTLSTELTKRGHQVAVATLWREGLSMSDRDGDVRVHRIRSTMHRMPHLYRNAGRVWAPPFPDPGACRALHRIVARERPDVVHGHDWLIRSFLPIKRSSNVPLVVSLHYYTRTCAKKTLVYRHAPCTGPGLVKCAECALDHYGPKGIPIAIGNWVMSAAERGAVDRFIAVSEATASGNGVRGGDLSCEVIPNFVPDYPDTPRDDVAHYLAQLPREDFLLFVGDFRENKGIDVLLRAYARITGAPPLVLIGKSYPDSPTEYPGNVIVVKDWPNDAVMAAWRRCLIALVPSTWPEPFGIVNIEAMTCARPVIASRIGGIPDIVADGETGLLVPPGDDMALQAAIERLLADPTLRVAMGQAGKRRVRQFQAEAVVPRIEGVYNQLVRARTRHDSHGGSSGMDLA